MACTRASIDPVAQAFLREYSVNLLKWPRANVELASVLVAPHNGPTRASVSLADLFGDAPDLPVKRDEALANNATSFTSDLDVDLGVSLLDRVAQTLGLSATASLQSSYARAKSVSIRIRDAKRHSVDIGALSRFLATAATDPAQRIYSDSDRLIVITATLTATSIDIAAKSNEGADAAIEAEATGLAKADSKLKTSRYGSHALNYKADQPLVFGVELMEIHNDGDGWRLHGIDTVEQLRGPTQSEIPKEAYVFIGGDRQTGDLFVDL